jgi:hypothetical protein
MIGLALFVVLVVLPIVLAGRSSWCFKVALGWDVLASAYLNGRPGETLSGRAGTAQAQGKLRGRILAPIINAIMLNPQHCRNAVRGDILRAQSVIADDVCPPKIS